MNAIVKPFSLTGSLLVTDTIEDAQFAVSQLRLQAIAWEQLGQQPLVGRDLLVIAETAPEALGRISELSASGIAMKHLRFIDTGYGTPLRVSSIDDLRVRFRTPKDFLWDHTRRMSDWPEDPPLLTISTMIDGLDEHARLTFPEVVVITGGYGSGKSAIAQMMALKVSHHYGYPISVIAWEDRRRGFRDRLWRTALGCSLEEAAEKNIDRSAAYLLERNVFWTEPLIVDDRTIAAQFDRMRYLTEVHGVKVHVLDPWNEFDHDITGEKELTYIRRVMMEAQKLTRDLGAIVFLVTHLPKSAYAPNGKVAPFRIVNATGSADFGNKSDHGFCVARTSLMTRALNGEYLPSEFEEGEIELIKQQLHQHPIPAPGTEHVILATDKVKIEPDMGKRGVQAYMLDKQRNDLVLDPLATVILKRMWDVF